MLATEIYKIINDLAPPIMQDMLIKRENPYVLRKARHFETIYAFISSLRTWDYIV